MKSPGQYSRRNDQITSNVISIYTHRYLVCIFVHKSLQRSMFACAPRSSHRARNWWAPRGPEGGSRESRSPSRRVAGKGVSWPPPRSSGRGKVPQPLSLRPGPSREIRAQTGPALPHAPGLSSSLPPPGCPSQQLVPVARQTTPGVLWPLYPHSVRASQDSGT